ncbi:ribosome small subunit-dependent GTPase A [Enterococcus sp. S22(2020)]|uniref:ribosome small subunit-dependent GTPase A n=1 Tax=Enterococcus sp. S22(2020) TaxID=2759151 RepID=UPI001CE121A6|nr:ribosome small subunit-dependent GTPase A [Enterococcus sp. S22(2020)]MCA5016215.1 ribosome small subunit-dependent GTPase A [Enterococcus sp. S22(2020)]
MNTTKIVNQIVEIKAQVAAVHKYIFEIISEEGIRFAHIKRGHYLNGQVDYPATGDYVMINWQGEDKSQILRTLPRRSTLSRADHVENKEQIIATNFDYIFILQAVNQDFNIRRLERYLTLAWQSGGVPVVILTKSDLNENHADLILAAQQVAIGTTVHIVSAHTKVGLKELDRYLKSDKTIVLVGSSGVGKSTLINSLMDKKVMKVKQIREKDGRGRHTTSHRQLFVLSSGAKIIDTPGMREVGIWNASEGLEQSFSDVEHYFGKCKFRDCQHQSEPNCAIKTALQAGDLSLERWESYLKLHAEAKYISNKTAYLKEKTQTEKGISKLVKELKSNYQVNACLESFICKECGRAVNPEYAGSNHRNHCPYCLTSIHADNLPGDRASLCKGKMDAISIWSKKDGEWAIIHRCRSCGTLKSNRIAADDDQNRLVDLANKAIQHPPFIIENTK